MLIRRFLPLVAAAAVVIGMHQLFDLWQGFAGTDLSMPAGRVRELIALEAKSSALIVADALLVASAIAWDSPRWIRRLGLAQIPIALFLLLASPLFLGDSGSVASSFAGPELSAFRVVVARTLINYLGVGVGLLLAARSLLALTRQKMAAPLT